MSGAIIEDTYKICKNKKVIMRMFVSNFMISVKGAFLWEKP